MSEPIGDSELLAIEARARAALDNVVRVEYAYDGEPKIDAIEGDVLRLVAEVRRLRKELEEANGSA